MVDDHTAWVKGSVPPPLDQRKFLPLKRLPFMHIGYIWKGHNYKSCFIWFAWSYFCVIKPDFWMLCSSSTRCQVWCCQWRLLSHRVLQWLLEPSEGLLPHQRHPDDSPTAPRLLPTVLVALAAVRRPKCTIPMELPTRRHLRAVGWRPRLCQGEKTNCIRLNVVTWN